MNDFITPRPTNISRTWAIVCYSRYEAGGSIVDRSVHIVTLTANAAGKLSALVDLEEATLDHTVMLLRWAKTDGTYEQISELRLPESQPVMAEMAAPIGNVTARLLHIELGRLGYRTSASHYEASSTVLGRTVTSLTAEEAALTRSFAYGQLGLPTGSVAA